MRTTAPVLIVLVIGVAGAMLGASGFSAAWGAPAPQTAAAQEEVNDSAARVGPEAGPASGPVSNTDSAVIGLISSAFTSFVQVAGAVLLIQPTLVSLGFPAWFAWPLGTLGQLLVGIGLAEFATNREWT